jgi:putative ABC transport system permease protein
MDNLVAANLSHHPGRTLVSVIGVAVGVILVVLTVGLVRGMLRDRGTRDANTGVEILLSLRQQRGLSLTSLPLSMPVEMADKIREVAGVAAITAVGQHLEMKGESGLGIRQVDGLEFDSYVRAAKVRIVDGEALPASGDVAIVDIKYAATHRVKPGVSTINIFDRNFQIAGIYAPETGARIMIPLSVMQQQAGALGKCSMLLVKAQNPEEQEQVAARIAERFPEFRILFTRDLPKLFAEGYGSFNIFLNVVTGLAAAISLLIISLTMFTSVSERTRQIGILKAMGASKRFIAGVFLKESLVISGAGVALGLAVALLSRAALVNGAGMKLEIAPEYVVFAALGGIVSGLLGALYPALRAASQDPVEALSYE